MGETARADNEVALSEPYAADADGGSAHCARVGFVEGGRHTLVGGDEDVFLAGGLDNGDKLVPFVEGERADAVCADIFQRALLHALDGAVSCYEHEIAVLIHAAPAYHCADALVGVYLDDVHDIAAARVSAGFGDGVAFLYEGAPLIREEEDEVMRGGGKDRFHIVLLLGRHGTDSLAAAALSAILADGQALDIAAVRERKHALLLLDKVLNVYFVGDVLNLGHALVPELVAQGNKLVLQDALYLLGVCEQTLEVVYLLLKLLILKLKLLAVETLQRDKAHIAYRLCLHLAETEALHQVLLCVVVAGAYDVDDLVDIVLRDEQTLQQMRPLLRLAQVKARSSDDKLLLVCQVLVQNVFE